MQMLPFALVAALDDEVQIIRSKMEIDAQVHVRPSLFMQGTYAGKPILLVRAGIGRQAMTTAMGYCLKAYRPQMVMHIGYCGAADPSLQAGDLIIASSLVSAQERASVQANAEYARRAEELCTQNELRKKVGSVVTVEAVASSQHDKAFIGTEHGACGIDMESYDVGIACQESQTPFLVVRAVLDPLDYDLPNLAGVIDDAGLTDGIALTGHLLRRPRDIMKLPKMQYFALQARRALTSFVDAWLAAEGS